MATLSETKGEGLEKETTQTIEVKEPVETTRGRTPLFLGLAVVLAALVGFGVGWLVFRDTGVDVPSDVRELLDDYQAAWEAHDGDLAVSYMTEGAAHISAFTGPEGFSGDRLASFIDGAGTFTVEDNEYVWVLGDEPYLVARSQTAGGDPGLSVFQIVERDGVLKIADQNWFALP